jgi:hypothetical protein
MAASLPTQCGHLPCLLAAEDHEGDPYPDPPSEFDREQNLIHSNLSRQELGGTALSTIPLLIAHKPIASREWGRSCHGSSCNTDGSLDSNAQCLADGATTSEKALLNGPMINYLQGQLRSAEVPDGAPPRVGSFSSLGG